MSADDGVVGFRISNRIRFRRARRVQVPGFLLELDVGFALQRFVGPVHFVVAAPLLEAVRVRAACVAEYGTFVDRVGWTDGSGVFGVQASGRCFVRPRGVVALHSFEETVGDVRENCDYWYNNCEDYAEGDACLAGGVFLLT